MSVRSKGYVSIYIMSRFVNVAKSLETILKQWYVEWIVKQPKKKKNRDQFEILLVHLSRVNEPACTDQRVGWQQRLKQQQRLSKSGTGYKFKTTSTIWSEFRLNDESRLIECISETTIIIPCTKFQVWWGPLQVDQSVMGSPEFGDPLP